MRWRRIGRYAKRCNGQGEHIVVTHEQAELDELWFAEVRPEGLPRVVVDVPLREQCIDCAQERKLAGAPPVRGRTDPHAFDRGGVEAGATSEPRVVLELVTAATNVGYAKNDKLGIPPREAPAGHQSSGKKEPTPEEPALPAQRAEEVSVGYSRTPRYQPAESPVGQADVAQPTGLDARRGMRDELRFGQRIAAQGATVYISSTSCQDAGGTARDGEALPQAWSTAAPAPSGRGPTGR